MFAALAVLLGALARPPSLDPLDVIGPVGGLAAAAVVLILERGLAGLDPRTLGGGAAGLLAGCAAAALALVVVPAEAFTFWPPLVTRAFLLLLLGYAGMSLGAAAWRPGAVGPRPAPGDGVAGGTRKILDTSAIIDGRIADVVETGFLEGTFVVPPFVLRELQSIADSQDALKRNRGRKGLDVLQRMKKDGGVSVVVSDVDVPGTREVDQKLIELARQLQAPLVTNDFNLNKVAELRGVRVLNVNLLANALKPVVLPGETVRLVILKEGKEANQGVGYLDDGTMVVVDNAKRYLGRSIEVMVTSVLQTTAGKMFFGRSEIGEDHVVAEARSRRAGA
jgi:uncharacterized protein YacL